MDTGLWKQEFTLRSIKNTLRTRIEAFFVQESNQVKYKSAYDLFSGKFKPGDKWNLDKLAKIAETIPLQTVKIDQEQLLWKDKLRFKFPFHPDMESVNNESVTFVKETQEDTNEVDTNEEVLQITGDLLEDVDVDDTSSKNTGATDAVMVDKEVIEVVPQPTEINNNDIKKLQNKDDVEYFTPVGGETQESIPEISMLQIEQKLEYIVHKKIHVQLEQLFNDKIV